MNTPPSVLESTRPRTRFAISYGWVNVVMGALAMVATMPGRTHILGLITAPLLDDLHLTPSEYSVYNFWAILVGTLLAWPLGWLVDRWGTRLVGTAVIASLGASVIGMAQVEDSTLLLGWLTLVRGLGQGGLSMISMAMVGKWFTRRPGPAMGVYSFLLGVGFLASYLAMQEAIKIYQWRMAWRMMGWSLLAGLAPLTLLLVRSLPPEETNPSPVEVKDGATLGEALRSPAFWVYSFAMSLYGLVWSGVMLFCSLILAERGFSNEFNTVMAISTACGLFSNLLGGFLSLKLHLGKVLGTGLAILALALVIFPTTTSQTQLMIYAVAFGSAGGFITVIYFTFYSQAFGSMHLARIQGTAHILSTFASAIGPVILTWSKDQTGSFDSIYYGMAAVVVLTGIAVLLVPIPARSKGSEK